MNEQQEKHLVRQFVEEGINRDNWNLADRLLSPTAVIHLGDEKLTRPQYRAWLERTRHTFAHFQLQIERMVGEGTMVSGRFEASGVQTGTAHIAGEEVPATNKQVRWQGSFHADIYDGQIQELWLDINPLALLHQLKGG